MKKTVKIVAMLLMVLCVTTFTFAQSSNTSSATKGTILADADKVMDVNNYKDVDFSNFFANTNISNGKGDFVFAKKFDNLYLGTYYNGDFLLPTTNTDEEVNSDESNTTTENELESTNSVTKTTTLRGNNYFAALFGLDSFALRLNARIQLDGNTTKSESTEIESMKMESDEGKRVVETSSVNKMGDNSKYFLGANLGGMNFDVSKVTVKPYASFGYTVNADGKLSKTTKTTVNSKISMGDASIITNTVDTEESTTTSKKSDKLSFSLGSQLEWGDKAGFFSVADLSYYIYTDVGMNGAVGETSTVEDFVNNETPEDNYTTTLNTVTYKESAKFACNEIYGSYRFEYAASEKLTLGARLGSSVEISTTATGYTWSESTSDDTRWTAEEREANNKASAEVNKEAKENALKGDLITTTTTRFSNDLAFGMKYQVKPAFAINFGFKTALPTYEQRKDVTSLYNKEIDEGADEESAEDNKTTIIDEKTVNSNWSNSNYQASYSLNAGFVWNIHENLSLDTVLNIGVNPSLQGILNDTMTIGVTYKM